MCKQVGIESYGFDLPQDASQEELSDLLQQLNNDSRVHGILVQVRQQRP